MTLFIRVTVYKSRVSVASSRPLPLGLVGETRTAATAVRACTSATVPVTLSIYDYLLHCSRTGADGLRLPRVADQLWPHHAVGFEEGQCKG